MAILAWFAGKAAQNDFLELFNLNKYFMGVFLLFIGFTIVFCICGICCGFISNIKIVRTICRVPFCCCSFIFLILILLFSGIMLAVWKNGELMIDTICGKSDGNSLVSKDALSGLYSFTTEIYDKMDTYYCTQYCPCYVKANTFKGANST